MSCALIAANDGLSGAVTLVLQSSDRGVLEDSACVGLVAGRKASCQTFGVPRLGACGPMGGYRHVCCCER